MKKMESMRDNLSVGRWGWTHKYLVIFNLFHWESFSARAIKYVGQSIPRAVCLTVVFFIVSYLIAFFGISQFGHHDLIYPGA